jgi:ADP-ribosylglycohydrolase
MDPHMASTETQQSQKTPSLTLHDRVLGCLLGGACGDALGAPVEFLSLHEIQGRYGHGGITAFDKAYGLIGAITDDTQMALFTVEGLIRAYVRQSLKGICHPPAVIHHAYVRWLATQDQSFESRSERDDLDGWLIADKRLWARRAPGNTCLSALRSNMVLGEFATNNSKGCGTVMRAAPFGFIARMTGGISYAFGLAVESARTTHGHPSAHYASGALALIIAHIDQGSTPEIAVDQALRVLRAHADAQEVRVALESAMRISRDRHWQDRLPELGEGWVAEEALAIAVLCAVAAKTPQEAIIATANHDGDTDSTAAIAGNIVGALHGPALIPHEWAEQVELRDMIETLAQDLTAVLEGRADPERLCEKYPGH